MRRNMRRCRAHGGPVTVKWELGVNCNPSRPLRIEWRETGGPAVAKHLGIGFGSGLITKLIPHALGGAVILAFETVGIHCTIDIPEDRVVLAG